MLGRQAPRRPVRRIGRRRLEGLDDDRFDHVVTDRALRTRPRCVNESVKALSSEAVPPLAHRERSAAELGGDLAVGAVAVDAGAAV